mmetsp:Transcript_27152/g.38633  ORF Transcript_27152/g.38633 Transcript_27152/m.38633 type:complete len:80 (+) Transcript_27152:733-972(+)
MSVCLSVCLGESIYLHVCECSLWDSSSQGTTLSIKHAYSAIYTQESKGDIGASPQATPISPPLTATDRLAATRTARHNN